MHLYKLSLIALLGCAPAPAASIAGPEATSAPALARQTASLPPIRDAAGEPEPLRGGIPHTGLAVVRVESGTYGVIALPDAWRSGVQAGTLNRAEVTWLYENNTCGDLHCETLGYRTAELPQGREVTPGYWQEAKRVVLKLDDAAGTLRQEGQQRYGKHLYAVNYFVTLHFAAQNGQPAERYSTLLTGLY